MKVVLDMNLSTRLAPWLCERGVDATRWNHIGDPAEDDENILAWCAREGACVVTLDSDLPEILRITGAIAPTVICIRDCDPVNVGTWERLLNLLQSEAGDIALGCLFTMKPKHIRMRRLPFPPGEPRLLPGGHDVPLDSGG